MIQFILEAKAIYSHGKIVNTYIVYEVSNNNINNSNYPTIKNSSFVAVSLTKNADIDKYKYFGYEIGFDGHGYYSHPSGGNGRNVIIFGVDMNSCTKIDNRKKYVLILVLGPVQRLEHTLWAKKCIQLILMKIMFELAL